MATSELPDGGGKGMAHGSKERVAVVTGVSRRNGIGFAIARRLAGRGVRLLLHSWAPHDSQQPWGGDPGGVPAILDELRAITPTEHIEADFSDPEAPQAVIDRARDAFRHVDVLIANHARSSNEDLEHLTPEELDRSFAVNARASLLLVREFAGQFDRPDGGRVVLMISGQHLGPMPDELPYIASKGVLHQVTSSLAAHLGPRGITVNAVNPGATDTGWATDEIYQQVLSDSPSGRWGSPEDAARLIEWLVSEEAGWITGQVINSTGGGP